MGMLTMFVPSSSSVVSSWSWLRPRPREVRSCPWPSPPGGSDSVLSWARCRAWGRTAVNRIPRKLPTSQGLEGGERAGGDGVKYRACLSLASVQKTYQALVGVV